MAERKRILIVDDDNDHLLVTKLILERRGYEVETLDRAERLLDVVSRFPPHLILMDHEMPSTDGIAATKLLKSDPAFRQIPVIYFSCRHDIRELAAQAGADDWFAKPFKIDDLVRKVGKYL